MRLLQSISLSPSSGISNIRRNNRHFRYSSFQLRLYSTFWHSFAVILLIYRLQK